MSKENPLSHHEQLRYDYLLKNIHYLNEREKKEFAYLQDKLSKASNDAISESQELTEDYRKTSANTSIPSYNSRSRSERYQKINSLPNKKTKINNVNIHDTEKPVDLMKILIENSSNENDLVLDPFMGSGSTGLACKMSKRNFIGIEIDKKYFNIAKERIGQNTLF